MFGISTNVSCASNEFEPDEGPTVDTRAGTDDEWNAQFFRHQRSGQSAATHRRGKNREERK